MSNTDIGKSDLNLTSLEITSFSPSDQSTTEDGVLVHTYYSNTQRYEFQLEGFTDSFAGYVNIATKLEPLSSAENFNFAIYSYANDDYGYPFLGNITNRLFLNAALTAGSQTFEYSSDTVNPASEAPNGLLAVGDFIQFKGASYPKTYRITSVNTTTHTYGVFPPLREGLNDNTEVLYNTGVKIKVRLTADTIRHIQTAENGQYREYSFNLAEDYSN